MKWNKHDYIFNKHKNAEIWQVMNKPLLEEKECETIEQDFI